MAGDAVVLIRYGEIGLKGDNRRSFEQRLAANLRTALSGRAEPEARAELGFNAAGGYASKAPVVRRVYGRLVIESQPQPSTSAVSPALGDAATATATAASMGMTAASPGSDGRPAGNAPNGRLDAQLAAAERLAAVAARVFGVVSANPALRLPLDIDTIEAGSLRLVGRDIAGRPGPVRFKVAARRSNKQFPLDSMELNRRLGAHLLKSFDPLLKVDVHEPEVTLHVEIRENFAYLYSRQLEGPGGLPVGVSSKGLLLLSGGLDSPVAAWMAMKRGMAVGAIHFHAIPFTSERAKQKVIDLAQVLAGYSGAMPLYLVHFTEVQKAIYAHCPRELGVTVMRRMMLRIAERIAARDGYPALLTGESLGQVASQTVESIAVIERVTLMPVLRPLIAFDKKEIVERATAIGTYEISIRPYEDCCTLFVPEHPATRPRLESVEAAESRLEVEALVNEAVQRTELLLVTPAGSRAAAAVGR